MKVVQINAVYEYSSTGRTTMEMHEYLRSQGIESHVFCTNKSIPENNVNKIGNNRRSRIIFQEIHEETPNQIGGN